MCNIQTAAIIRTDSFILHMTRTTLTEPTDFMILEELSDGKRNTAANLASHLDKDRNYLNTRLTTLADYGILEKIGPAENSGIYQITSRGIAAVQNQTLYQQNREQFEAILDSSEADSSR